VRREWSVTCGQSGTLLTMGGWMEGPWFERYDWLPFKHKGDVHTTAIQVPHCTQFAQTLWI
jgi:hypothetical protein